MLGMEIEKYVCAHKMGFMSLTSMRLVYLNMLSKRVKCATLDLYKQVTA